MTYAGRTSSNDGLSKTLLSIFRKFYEAHFSTVGRPSETHAWVSCPHAHKGRKSGDPREASKGSGASWRLRRSERYRNAQRLRGEGIFRILRAANRRRADCVSVQVRPNGLNYSRLGLIVPKRFLPRAVDRNCVKRVLREWFRRNQAPLIGQDLLVRVDARPSELESLIADVERALVSRR